MSYATVERSTLKLDVERNGGNGQGSAAPETTPWWFGLRDRLIAPRGPRTTEPANERSASPTAPSTFDQLRARDLTGLTPIARRRPWLGKRGFVPVYQWEGVVEEVNGEGFRARLQPFEQGHSDSAQIEYADFEYDDLADESDRGLVAKGAVF
jgi:hypothetical protein